MIEFQFFDGCPNSEKTLENLRQWIKEKSLLGNEVKITEIMNPDEADVLHFQGSPTILVNGVDIYTGMKPATSSFSCRSYILDGKRTGILSKEFIGLKISEMLHVTS